MNDGKTVPNGTGNTGRDAVRQTEKPNLAGPNRFCQREAIHFFLLINVLS